ncbi:hypothetical protein AAHK20_24970 [Trinickia sp. YCB016]
MALPIATVPVICVGVAELFVEVEALPLLPPPQPVRIEKAKAPVTASANLDLAGFSDFALSLVISRKYCLL